MLAGNVFKIPESHIRVVTGDVGGGFGTKGWQYRRASPDRAGGAPARPAGQMELRAQRGAARRRAWPRQRRRGRAGARQGWKFIGARALISNVGAYLSSDRNLLATFGRSARWSASTTFPLLTSSDRRVSNTNATAPYRGAGRPEAIYIIERLIDDAARELQIDRIELRRKNLHPALEAALSDARSASTTTAAISRHHGEGAEARRVAGFATRREVAEARQAARPRHRQCDRAGGRPARRNSPSSASTRAARRPC